MKKVTDLNEYRQNKINNSYNTTYMIYTALDKEKLRKEYIKSYMEIYTDQIERGVI